MEKVNCPEFFVILSFSFLYWFRTNAISAILGEDDAGGGDSSKSNSITSEQSIQSTGISASSQSSSTSSIPPRSGETDTNSIYPLSVRNRTKVHTFFLLYQNFTFALFLILLALKPYHLFLQSLHTNNGDRVSSGGDSLQVGSTSGNTLNTTNHFATIRTTSIVSKQQKEHMQEEMHEQMSGYKRMRREHQSALIKVSKI